MAKAKAKDVIERRYLQLKLNRDRRTAIPIVAAYINSVKLWLKGSPKRTTRKGGLGR